MCKSFNPVSSVSIETALQSFTKFLEKNLHTCGGNQDNLLTVIIGDSFGDSLPLIRTLLSHQHSLLKQSNREFCHANLCSVYKYLFNEHFNAHDALEDAVALEKILFNSELAIDANTIVDCCHISPVVNVKADLKFIDNQYNCCQTFIGNLNSPNKDHGSFTHRMVLKIAKSGLLHNDLLVLWEKFGGPGIFCMPPCEFIHDRSQHKTSDKSRPRATKNKRILSNIVKYFKSNNVSNKSNTS